MGCRYKYHLVLLLFLISPNSYSQLADTVKVVTQTPDGTGQPGIEVVLDDHAGFRYDQQTDSLGTVVFTSVPTPVEGETNPLILLGYALMPGYPNPAKNHPVSLRYQVPTEAVETNVKITIYDIRGRKVRELVNEDVHSGVWETAWDLKNERGEGVADGVYIYSLEADNGVIANKMLVLGSNGPSLYQRVNKSVGSAPEGKKLAKTAGKDYALKLEDTQGRFETPPEENVTIEGDTTFIRTVYELFQNNAPGSISGNEGDTLGVAKDWFQFATGLDTLINNSDQWKVVGSDKDSLYFATTDSSANGSIPLILKAKAIYGTEKDVEIPVNLADLVTLSGKIVDLDDYQMLENRTTGLPLASVYLEDTDLGKIIDSPDGYFTIRTPARDTAHVWAQQIAGTDTLSYSRNFKIPALTDMDSLLLSLVTFKGVEGNEAKFKFLMDVANEQEGALGYVGKKGLDRDDSTTNKYIIPGFNVYTETVTPAQQDSVEQHIQLVIHPGQQRPMAIEKWGQDTSVTLGLGGGRVYVFVRPNKGHYSIGTADFNKDGKIDEVYIDVGMRTNELIDPPANQELISAEYGPNEVFNAIFNEFSVLYAGNSSGSIFYADQKGRQISVNIPPRTLLKDYMGGVDISSLQEQTKGLIAQKINQNTIEQKKFLLELYSAAENNPNFHLTDKAKTFLKELRQSQ